MATLKHNSNYEYNDIKADFLFRVQGSVRKMAWNFYEQGGAPTQLRALP